jgi:DNA modification methylase
MRRPILNNSSPGEPVYDPFLGSGTTLIAAETTGRVCLGLEIDPRYVDVAIRRWQAFTGRRAVLADDNRAFDVIAQERSPSAPSAQTEAGLTEPSNARP